MNPGQNPQSRIKIGAIIPPVHVRHANDLHIRHQVDVSDTREICTCNTSSKSHKPD